MSTFKLKNDKENIVFEVPGSLDLEQILEAFSLFLKENGFEFYGYLDIYPYDDLK